MNTNSFYPVLGVQEIQKSKEFYTTVFSFEVTFDSDWYVSLKSKKQNFELALLSFDHPTVPKNFRKPVQGLLLNFEVENVDREYDRLKNLNLNFHLDIKSEDWGQRHFIVSDPNEILIDVIQIIPASEEFLKQYS